MTTTTTPNHPEKLIVHCPEHLAAVRDFADRTEQREAFETKLADLAHDYTLAQECYTHLYSDFAPMSFYFVKTLGKGENAQRYYNGGLIYHGPHDGNGSGQAPTFSVSLTPASGWCIHT